MIDSDYLIEYLKDEITVERIRGELSHRINRLKGKIDKLQEIKESLSDGLLSNSEKDNIKYIIVKNKMKQTELDVLKHVYEKMRKQNMKKFNDFRAVMLRHISIQITRFDRILPDQLKGELNQSRIKRPVIISKINSSNKVEQNTKEEFEQDSVGIMMQNMREFIQKNSINQKEQEKGLVINLEPKNHYAWDRQDLMRKRDRQDLGRGKEWVKKIACYVCLSILVILIVIVGILVLLINKIIEQL